MKVNSVSSINYNKYNQSFKRTAIPYPEYEKAYFNTKKSNGVVSSLLSQISDLFSPQVTTEAVEIKSQIDKIYGVKNPSPKDHLLSVLA